MMDDRTANFGAAQYTVKYSNFTLDDKLLNLMGKMNNTVHLIINPFHLKGKTLHPIGHLKLNSAPAAAETWDLKVQILKSGRMCSWIILIHPFALNLRERRTFTVGWQIWSRQDQKNASLKLSLLLNIHDIPSGFNSGIQLCVGYWIYIIQIKFHIHKLCNIHHTHKINAQSFN
jgi:hypothetical protein